MIDGSDSEERRPQDGLPIRVKIQTFSFLFCPTHQGLVGFKSLKFDLPCFCIPHFFHLIPYIDLLKEKTVSASSRLSDGRAAFFNWVIL